MKRYLRIHNIARRRMFALIFGTSIAATAVLLAGCSNLFGGSGKLSLSLTDAPIVASNITGVYLTIDSIDLNVGNTWQPFSGFTGSGTPINLLDFANGLDKSLGTASLPSGTITQIRFNLNIPMLGSTSSNPGCYIQFADGTQKPLFVPSGGQTGYKAIGPFTVPVNGSVNITADFDVQKMVVQTGSGDYILRPAIRLTVADQAGTISGTVSGSNLSSYGSVVVYAYSSGTYSSSELTSTSDTPPFSGAVTSSILDTSSGDTYKLAYLAPGTYNLVVAAFDSTGALVTSPSQPLYAGTSDITVTSGKTTTADITIP